MNPDARRVMLWALVEALLGTWREITVVPEMWTVEREAKSKP